MSWITNTHLWLKIWCLLWDAFQFAGEMGPDFSPTMSVKSLTSQQIVRIHQLFRQAKFDDPSGDVCRVCCFIYFNIVRLFLICWPFVFSYSSFIQCLSPAGEYNLRLGIIKELQPDMVATYAGRLDFLLVWNAWSNYCILWENFFETHLYLSAFLVDYRCNILFHISNKSFAFYFIASLLCFSPQIFEGHPFIVEAGISLGGKDVKQVQVL